MIDEKSLSLFCPEAVKFIGPLNEQMGKAKISTPLRIAHFLAQVAHESGGFKLLRENLNYSADALVRTWPKRFTPETAKAYARNPEKIANKVYADRMGNGPEASGDGFRYLGRGLIQTTGKDNYRAFSAWYLGNDSLLKTPELLEQPPAAAASAVWFWDSRKLNQLADRDAAKAICRMINGGLHGIEDRLRWLDKAKHAFGA
jgi:putative chitinase